MLLKDSIIKIKRQNWNLDGRLGYTQEYTHTGPGWVVAQLVRASAPYAKVAGLIPGQGTYKKQSMTA